MYRIQETAASLVAALLSVSLCAQNDAATAVSATHAPHFVKADALIGAKVQTGRPAPTDPAVAVAARDRDGDFKPVEIGTVKELIVDVGSGHGTFAILSNGDVYCVGEQRMHDVPCIWWDEASKRFTLDMSRAGRTIGNPPSEAAAYREVRKNEDGRKPETELKDRTADLKDRTVDNRKAHSDAPLCLVTVAGVRGLKVIPQGEQAPFGKVDDVIIDVRRGCVGYMAVSSGGVIGIGDTTRLVPWQAARIAKTLDLKENEVRILATKANLESAPKFDSKTNLNDPNLRTDACTLFKCEDPWDKTTNQEAKHDMENRTKR